jgi:hypothetical protein
MADFEITGKVTVEQSDLNNVTKNIEKAGDAAKSLKQQFREATQELQRLSSADIVDEEKVKAAAQRVGQLKDAIGDANEAAGAFAGNTFENLEASISGVQEGLMTLDFDKVSGMASSLATNAKTAFDQLNGFSAGVLNRLKEGFLNLGASGKAIFTSFAQNPFGALASGASAFGGALKGLTSNIWAMGKALLANPIFLLAAIIVAVVVGIIKLMDALGILKPILDAIKAAIGFVVDGFKAMTDWLGLTSHATDEHAANTIKRNEEMAKSHQDRADEAVRQIDNEIKRAEAQGKSTEGLERQKLALLKKTREVQYKLAQEAFQESLKKSELDQEEIKNLKEKARLARVAYAQSKDDIINFETEVTAEKKKANEKQVEDENKANEKAKSDRQKAYEQRIAQEKAFQEQRKQVIRQIEDLNIALMQEGIDRELKENQIKYDRLIEDTKNNEKLLASEKEAINKLYLEQQFEGEKEIRKGYADETKAALDAAEETKRVAAEEQRTKELERIANNAALRKELFDTEQQKEIDAIKAKYAEKALLAEGNVALMGALAVREGEEIAAINKKYAEQEKAAKMQEMADKAQIASDYASSVNNIAQGIFDISNNLGKQDEKSKEERAKRQFKVQKALNLSMAIIDGFKAITTSLAQSPIAIGPVPNPAGIASLAFAAVTSAVNIAKIASSQYKPSGGGGGGSSAPTPPSGGGGGGEAPTPPAINLFGSAMNQGAQGQQEAGQRQRSEPVVRAVVVESDITNTQKRMATYQQRSEIG